MRKRKPAVLLGLIGVMAIVLAACGGASTNTSQGDAIFDTRGAVAGAEGLFQRGESSESVVEKANANGLTYRLLEVENFIAGTRNTVIVTEEPGQQWEAYIFLPPSATEQGTMVVVARDNNTAQAILGWDCNATKIFLGQAGITDFTNEFCS